MFSTDMSSRLCIAYNVLTTICAFPNSLVIFHTFCKLSSHGSQYPLVALSENLKLGNSTEAVLALLPCYSKLRQNVFIKN